MSQEKNKIITKETNEKKKEEQKSMRKKNNKARQFVKFFAIAFAVLLFFLAIAFVWMWDFDLLAWTDAMWFAFAVLLLISWGMFVYNKNIFSPFLHGIKTFGLALVGKRSKDSYYEYTQRITENPIPTPLYIAFFSITGLTLIVAVILTIIFYQVN